MASPLISDEVRYKVDHKKFYFVQSTWRSILKCDPTTFHFVNKPQAISLIRALVNNPFVEDVKVYDGEGNVAHYSPLYDEYYACELVKQLNNMDEKYSLSDFQCRTNQGWQKILLERKRQLSEAKLNNPNKQCKLYKGKVMVKGVNCMINGAARSDGAEFPPDCDAWWLKENLDSEELHFSK